MCQNISAFGKSNKKESVNNTGLSKMPGIYSFRITVPGFKQQGLSIDGSHIIVHLSSVRKTSDCPYCGQRTKHVHSYYFRRIEATECFNMSTVLLVKARRFRCKHCTRTFSEPLPGIAPRYGRRTQEVLNRIKAVSLNTYSGAYPFRNPEA